jgi:hypothetical protein
MAIEKQIVMAGFIPAIHVLRPVVRPKDVDGRNESGHDDAEYYRLR